MNIPFKKDTIKETPKNPENPQKLLNKVIEYYHKTFFEDKKASEFLKNKEGINQTSSFTRLKIGYSNGTLVNTIPREGGVTAKLKELGVLEQNAKEKFQNSIIFPVLDNEGNCTDIYGRRITEEKPTHIYLYGKNKIDLREQFKKEEEKTKEKEIEAKRDIEEETTPLKDGLFIRYNNRKYLIRGIENTNSHRLKVNLKAINETRFHIDSLDLYISKQRKAYSKETAILFHTEPEITEEDLNRIIEKTEDYIQGKKENTQKVHIIPDEEKTIALNFLKSPDLIDIILKDFKTIGCQGEETNKIIGYLIAISRKLPDPLSLLILSRSAAGKSTLQDSILELIPEEDKVKYTRITGQALFYKGEDALDHKIIAIEEQEGAQDASYSLRNIQTSRLLTTATTIKDPLTGDMKTKEYTTKMNTSLMLTTTKNDIDEETMNRFIITTIDESKKQTELIHELQREKDTLIGLLSNNDKETVIKKHHNAQRLLRPIKVVNSYAKYLTFAIDKLRARRDHKKYLSLIKAITFLFQYQRPVKTIEHNNKTINYIETTLEDISFANRLASEVLGRSLDELAPQSRRLLILLKKMKTEYQARGEGKVQVSRRDIRHYTGWSDHQVRDHLKQLIDLEYVRIIAGKNGFRYLYELIYEGGGEDGKRFLLGLIDLKTLREKMKKIRPCG